MVGVIDRNCQILRPQVPPIMCFAMIKYKNQGKIFYHVGVYQSRPVFSHGQLCIAI